MTQNRFDNIALILHDSFVLILRQSLYEAAKRYERGQPLAGIQKEGNAGLELIRLAPATEWSSWAERNEEQSLWQSVGIG